MSRGVAIRGQERVVLATWLVIALGIASANLRLIPPLAGFTFLTLGTPVLLGMAAWGLLRLVRRRPDSRRPATIALASGAAWAAILALATRPGWGEPTINDATTDLDDPPAYASLSRGERDGYPSSSVPFAREAHGDLRSVVSELDPIMLDERARGVANTQGWAVLQSDGPGFEATDESAVFHFVDEIVVRIRPGPGGGSTLDVRSRSRDGKGDLGVNARRIRAFLAALDP